MTDGCVMGAHTDRSTTKPSLIVIQCFALGEEKKEKKRKSLKQSEITCSKILVLWRQRMFHRQRGF